MFQIKMRAPKTNPFSFNKEMFPQLLLSFVLGSISFLFFSFVSSFSILPLFLGYFAQLPLFLLGFIAGRGEVFVAGACGTLLNFLFSGETHLLSYALFYVAPAVFLAYLLSFSKKELSALYKDEKVLESFVGQGLILGGLSLTLLLFLIFESHEVQSALNKSLHKLLSAVSYHEQATFSALLEKVILYFPALMSLAWMAMTLGNIGLAQVIAKHLKKSPARVFLLKNWSVFQWQYWLLVTSLAGALFLSKPEAFLMQNLTFVALVPFLIEGVAIFHEIYPKITTASWGIIIFYGMVLILGWPIVVLIFLGIFEPWFHVRRRFADYKVYRK